MKLGAGMSLSSGSRGVAKSKLPASLKLLLFPKDIQGRVIPNRLAPADATPYAKILTSCPRECFVTAAVGDLHWLNTGFTVTANYANDLDGTPTATRMVSTSAGSGLIQYRETFSRPAGVYTLVAHLQSNAGNFTFQWTRDSGTTWNDFTVTNVMTRHAFEINLGSTATLGLRIRPAAGVTADVNVGCVYLWDGAAATAPAFLKFGGHAYVGDVPAESVSVVDEALRLATGQCLHIDLAERTTTAGATQIVVTRRLDQNSTNGFEERFLHNVLANSSGNDFGFKEAELGSTAFQLQGRFGGKTTNLPTGGFSPNLFSPRNDINVLTFASGSDGSLIWMGDTILAQEITSPPPSSRTIQHLQYGSTNSFPRRHEVFAIAYADAKLNPAEKRKVISHIRKELAKGGKNVFLPRNHIQVGIDSNTASATSWAQQMLAELAHPSTVMQDAIGGSMLAGNGVFQLNFSNRLPAIINGTPTDLANRAAISIILGAANDLQPIYNSASAYLAVLDSQLSQLKAVGRKIVVIQPLPKGSAQPNFAAHNSMVAEVNATLASWLAAGKIDRVVEISNNSLIGTFESTSNATYWSSDGIHLTTAGQTVLKNLVVPVVNSLLLPV